MLVKEVSKRRKIDTLILRWVLKKTVKQGYHRERIIDLLQMLGRAMEKEFTEDTQHILKLVLRDCLEESFNGWKEPQAAGSDTEMEEIRKYLWLNHGCPISELYGDDGEMQCNNTFKHSFLDFKRQPCTELIQSLNRRGWEQNG